MATHNAWTPTHRIDVDKSVKMLRAQQLLCSAAVIDRISGGFGDAHPEVFASNSLQEQEAELSKEPANKN